MTKKRVFLFNYIQPTWRFRNKSAFTVDVRKILAESRFYGEQLRIWTFVLVECKPFVLYGITRTVKVSCTVVWVGQQEAFVADTHIVHLRASWGHHVHRVPCVWRIHRIYGVHWVYWGQLTRSNSNVGGWQSLGSAADIDHGRDAIDGLSGDLLRVVRRLLWKKCWSWKRETTVPIF